MSGLEMVSADMRQEAERQDWEADSKNEEADEASRRANVDMLKQLTADTASAGTVSRASRLGTDTRRT